MLTLTYMVGGWVWQNAYVINRIIKKIQKSMLIVAQVHDFFPHNFFVQFYREANIPFDPYLACAMLASYRALVSIFASSIIGKCKRRPLYMACCGVIIVGHLTLSSYFYFNHDGSLTKNFPVARWVPILSVTLGWTGLCLGYGSMVYILQVIYY